jgi:hypothetical protein
MPENPSPRAVRQQLHDELLARTWSVSGIDPCRPVADRCSVEQRVDEGATHWIALLGDPCSAERRDVAGRLHRLLWPTFAPAAEWWTTPLGQTLLTARPDLALYSPPTPTSQGVLQVVTTA